MLAPHIAIAQIVPDNTLGSKVTSSTGAQLLITGGSVANRNLFHSFDRFSLDSGQTAIFAPDSSIANIITRVTGREASNINGTIAVNGNANLFLINPNGIVFGQNASLAINGSFFATTAPGLRFADGTILSANRSEPPLLTISAPIAAVHPTAPITNAGNLSVGRDLLIVAGDVSGSGQFAAANRVSIEANTLTLNQARIFAGVGGTDLQVRDAIVMTDSQINSIVDASQQSGDINIKARSLMMQNGSRIDSLIPPKAQGRSGHINVAVQDELTIQNDSINGTPSGINSSLFGQGTSGNIAIESGSLRLSGGSYISTTLNGTGQTGSIALNVQRDIQLQGAGADPTRIDSAVLAGVAQSAGVPASAETVLIPTRIESSVLTGGIGHGGNIQITADTVSLADRARIVTYTFGAGAGGGIDITARDRVLLKGTGQLDPVAAQLISSLFLTQNLRFENGFVIGENQVRFPVSAVIYGATKQTGIFAAAGIGSTGNIRISVPRIEIANRAAINASNWTFGDTAGVKLNATEEVTLKDSYIFSSVLFGKGSNLDITTPSLRLDNSQIITATGIATDGNILLNIPRVLLLRNESRIIARSYNNANGGNININANLIVAKPNENINIVANAFRGRGGNINITARSILGIQYSPFPTSGSNINASSRYGVSGEVKLNVLRSDPGSQAVKLPTEVTDTPNQIDQTCSGRSRVNSFTRTGRGGIAPDLAESNRSTLVWVDGQSSQTSESQVKEAQIVEATGWIKNSAGQIVLLSDSSDAPMMSPVVCEP